jgi:hypothetical protein
MKARKILLTVRIGAPTLTLARHTITAAPTGV